MEILYISPIGKKKRNNIDGELQIYDFEKTSSTIKKTIEKEFPNDNVTMVIEIASEKDHINIQKLKKYDIFLCDLTTMNPNVLYHTGQIECLQKPIIYFHSSDARIPSSLTNKKVNQYSEASLENEFQTEIKELIKLAKSDPEKLINSSNKATSKPKAFISYSHTDTSYLNRLMVHLKPLSKKGLIDVWVDTKLKSGDRWKEEIENALSDSSIAILMVSANFMASDFIIDNELPPLLSKAEVKGTRILPVIVSPCRFSREPSLNRFQAINSPSTPLSKLTEDQREEIYDQLAGDIEKSLEDT